MGFISLLSSSASGVLGSSGRVPSAIPLPDVQGGPWRFGRRQRTSAISLETYRPGWPALPPPKARLRGRAIASFRVAGGKVPRDPDSAADRREARSFVGDLLSQRKQVEQLFTRLTGLLGEPPNVDNGGLHEDRGRMRTVVIDRPGSATVTYDVRHTQLDPLTWLADPSVDVVVEITADHVAHVESRLGMSTSRTDDGDRVTLTIPVTHRAAVRHRLYELGTRVRVLAPEDVRTEIVKDLEAHAEVAT